MTSSETSPEYVEQYLLFDPTEFIKGIGYIGTVATVELIYNEEPKDLSELLQPQAGETDSLPRLFEV